MFVFWGAGPMFFCVFLFFFGVERGGLSVFLGGCFSVFW